MEKQAVIKPTNGISHHPYFIYSHSDVSHVINIKE